MDMTDLVLMFSPYDLVQNQDQAELTSNAEAEMDSWVSLVMPSLLPIPSDEPAYVERKRETEKI